MAETTTPTVDVIIPAWSEVMDEKFKLQVPPEWAPRIEAIAATGCTVYGPKYQRPVMETLTDLSRKVRSGYRDLALSDLEYCERKAGL